MFSILRGGAGFWSSISSSSSDDISSRDRVRSVDKSPGLVSAERDSILLDLRTIDTLGGVSGMSGVPLIGVSDCPILVPASGVSDGTSLISVEGPGLESCTASLSKSLSASLCRSASVVRSAWSVLRHLKRSV